MWDVASHDVPSRGVRHELRRQHIQPTQLHLLDLIRSTSPPEEANPSLPLAGRVGASEVATAAPACVHPIG